MRRWVALFLVCSCAAAKPVVRSQTCQHAYDQCNNRCFASPNYKRNGPQCVQTQTLQVCPQESQIIDTVAAAKCFDSCEWAAKLCQ